MESREATVSEILEEVAKHGVSAKTGKDWSMARVSLSNGDSTFIFNPIKVGDKVREVQNGEFKNWQIIKSNPQHEEITTLLNKILTGQRETYTMLKKLIGEGTDE